MSPDLLFTLLSTLLIFVVVPGVQFLATTALPAPKPAPSLDERDLLDTDPRGWVRQAEQIVAHGGMGLMTSAMRMQRDIERPCDSAPRFACIICGVYDVDHTHNLEAK